MTIWSPVMFCDELAMLDVRLAETEGLIDWHIVVESDMTHRGVPKPLHLMPLEPAQLRYVRAYLSADAEPWANEHAQRDAAWPLIDARAADDDWVLISDVDEIPSPSLLVRLANGELPDPCAIRMRVFLYAVDWEVPQQHLPPQCVAATVGYIRAHGGSLAVVRDGRASYPEVGDGGWHFSWLGGPDAQRLKLHEKTCHTELLSLPVRYVIESGACYATGADGGGLPVRPVTVDDSWPAMIQDRRVPPEWFRP